MKKSIFVLASVVACFTFANTSRAQYTTKQPSGTTKGSSGDVSLIPRQSELAPTDVRPQFENALRQKKDGDVVLYTDEEGTRIYLPVKGGHPGVLHAASKSGKAVTLRPSTERGKCFVCWGPLCKYKIQVQCPNR